MLLQQQILFVKQLFKHLCQSAAGYSGCAQTACTCKLERKYNTIIGNEMLFRQQYKIIKKLLTFIPCLLPGQMTGMI